MLYLSAVCRSSVANRLNEDGQLTVSSIDRPSGLGHRRSDATSHKLPNSTVTVWPNNDPSVPETAVHAESSCLVLVAVLLQTALEWSLSAMPGSLACLLTLSLGNNAWQLDHTGSD
ncbi:unnamed protein product [Protopolystoma xenopodis]|uniref:Uncharacterized protein n=1 Tax=Protopolystoma xenopodis TaxID=117903 RepID=A0A448X4D4_9PLAT|nr:unnamed protein product [Protopolystoma xenopodis]